MQNQDQIEFFTHHFQFLRDETILNHTAVTEFILLGLTDDPVLQKALFGVFLVIYLSTLAGNLGHDRADQDQSPPAFAIFPQPSPPL